MQYLYQTCISSKWGSQFLRHTGNFGLLTLTWLLEAALIVLFMFQYCVWFLNVYKNFKSKKHPYWVCLWAVPKPHTWSWACQMKPMWHLSVIHPSSHQLPLKGFISQRWLLWTPQMYTIYNNIFQAKRIPIAFIFKPNIFLSVILWWDVLVLHVYVDQIQE